MVFLWNIHHPHSSLRPSVLFLGEVVVVGPMDGNDFNPAFAAIKVTVNFCKPLLMGFYITLDNKRRIRVECWPERIFMVCKNYGRIGHIISDCNWLENIVILEQDIQDIMQRLNVIFAFDPSNANFGSIHLHIKRESGRKTMLVIAHFHLEGTKYLTLDHTPIKFLIVLFAANHSSNSYSSFSSSSSNFSDT